MIDLDKAKQFMIHAHAGQTRWDGRPYEIHPIKVVEILESFGIGDKEILAAGYLHDIVEDTQYGIGDLNRVFGATVAGYVCELTFEPGKSDYYYWLKCSELSPNAKIIKAADILSNIGDKGKKSEHFLQKRAKALQILLKGIIK